MNEDLTYTMGLNTDPFARALKRAGQYVDDASSAIKKKFSSIADSMASMLGAAAIIGFIRSMSSMAESIRRTSIEVGVSTDYFQNFSRLLRSSGVDAEMAEKGLDKLNTRLGLAQENGKEFAKMQEELGFSLTDNIGKLKSTQQVNDDVADAIKNAATEQQASAIAAAAYGAKLSIVLIPALRGGSSAIAEMGSKAKMSKGDIDSMHKATNNIKDAWNDALIAASKFYNFLDKVVTKTRDALGTPIFTRKDVNRVHGAGGTWAEDGVHGIDSTQTQAYKDGLKEISELKSKELKVDAHQAEYSKAKMERDEAQLKLAQASKEESVDRNNLIIEAEKKVIAFEEARKVILEDVNRQDENAARNLKKKVDLIREQRDLTYEISKAQEHQARQERQLFEKQYAHISVAELHSINRRLGGQWGDDQQKANRITWLESWAEQNRKDLYFDKSNEQRDEARRLRKTLSTNVDQEDREPNTQLLDEIKDSTSHLKFLKDKAAGKGIPVDVSIAP
jgi:hypothetical protein